MSVYSNNFWSYAKNYGKEATLDEVFVKWANKIDLEIELGKEIFKEVTAEVNSLFGKKEALVQAPVGNPMDINSVPQPVQDPATMQTPPVTNYSNPKDNTGISSDKPEVELDENGQPKKSNTMLEILTQG